MFKSEIFTGSKFNSQKVINVLENARNSGERIRVLYGKDGVIWNEENDVMGTVGRSTGVTPCALLINNSRSMGGGALLTDCIIGIYRTDGTRIFWDEAYTIPKCEVITGDLPAYPFNVNINGELYGRCSTEKQAQNLADFMSAKRFKK